MTIENPTNIPIERGRQKSAGGTKLMTVVAPAVTAGCVLTVTIEINTEAVAAGYVLIREPGIGFKIETTVNMNSETFVNWVVYNS